MPHRLVEQVDQIALSLLEQARETKISVARDAIRSFGRSAWETLLAAPASPAALKAKLTDYKAGDWWARIFVKRNGLYSQRLHAEAGRVDHEAIKKVMKEIRALCANSPPRFICNVDETGLQWNIMPRRTYLSNHEDWKMARGSKGMHDLQGSNLLSCAATLTARQRLTWPSSEIPRNHVAHAPQLPLSSTSRRPTRDRYRDVPQVVGEGLPVYSALHKRACAAADGLLLVAL